MKILRAPKKFFLGVDTVCSSISIFRHGTETIVYASVGVIAFAGRRLSLICLFSIPRLNVNILNFIENARYYTLVNFLVSFIPSIF